MHNEKNRKLRKVLIYFNVKQKTVNLYRTYIKMNISFDSG